MFVDDIYLENMDTEKTELQEITKEGWKMKRTH